MTAVINNQIRRASCVLVLAFFGLLGSLEVSALQCEPINPDNDNPADSTGVSVCEGGSPLGQNLSAMTELYPSDGQFSATKEFQIRSCGRFGCARAAYFNVRSAGVTLNNATSEIPLNVSIEQTAFGKSVDFPANTTCNSDDCDFRGAGLFPFFRCEECLNFKLTIEAKLNDLIKEGTLTQSGKHSGTLTFTIDQAPSTAGITAGDAGVNWPVNLYIELDIPALIRISGLRDMTLDSTSGSGTRKFCVFALGADNFKLKPDSSYGSNGSEGKDFQLRNGDESIRYTMVLSDQTGKNETISYSKSYSGWEPSKSFNCEGQTNQNMTVTIEAKSGGSDGKYSDTMTLYVEPEF
ncbi:hypothetical protein J7438_10915 [Thalassotalea sp. G20_0]|uniref:hypothetical protein n=1 Tax=Thalassotalea sp. G20_0 TaxID=2821093 RepID=UPI001AD9D9E4|nr:hypothetical protein [Thalassotalea sp. G20_0]MBO9494597.1 hypothetical protein [Thalassotalea sp. G20_0]